MNHSFGNSLCKVAISLTLIMAPHALASDGFDDNLANLLTRGLPERALVAPGGRAFLDDLAGLSIAKREEAILEALGKGYFPDFMRAMRPVTVKENGHTLTFWVMPDYVSVGNNEDYVLIPLSFVSARKLANSWGFVLPTPKMVDSIFRQAECIIWPRTFKPATEMVSVAWLEAHNEMIQSQRFGELDMTRLAAGHKKDIVLSPRLKNLDKKIAIYGWQNIRNGENIQPLSTWHGDHYVDYSHGLRMVGSWAMLDGRLVSIKKLMADPDLSALLSREGPIPVDQLLLDPQESATPQPSM